MSTLGRYYQLGLGRHKALNIVKLGLDYIYLREAAAKRSTEEGASVLFLFCNFSLLFIDYMGKINLVTTVLILVFN